METYDYIIVGAGSAGSVLANRLSADSRNTVCVLEAGGRDWNPFIHIPAGFMRTFYDPRVNWNYEMEPSTGSAGRRIHAPRGKTLGGSSSINGHIYNRGQDLDFDGWAQRGNRNWDYAHVLAYFRRMENRIGGGDPTFRGTDGELAVTDINWSHPLCEAFIEGAVELGIPRNPDYNATRQEGVAYAQRTIFKGRRMSAARAFLNPAKKRSNLTVRTRIHVTEIVLDGNRVTGIRFKRGGRNAPEETLKANREVLLAAGAYNSPLLLQLSGIGNPRVLSALGIPTRHTLPGVGENLRDHYAPRLVARVKNIDTINELSRGTKLVKEVARWVASGRGILSLSPTLVYCFWYSSTDLENPDLQITFTPASYREGVQGELEQEGGMTTAVWQQRPQSSGTVRPVSNDPFDAPAIQPNYLHDEYDRRVIIEGMKLARSLLETDALAPYYDFEAFPGKDVQTDDELLDAARARGTTTFHPAGTCRMGPATDPTAVVDDELRVHGLDGLRVVDASIVPMMLSANLNAATMMIAEKASDMILGKAPPDPVVLD